MADSSRLPQLSRLLLQLTGLLTESTISNIRNFVYESMTWMGRQAETISDYPVVRNTELAHQLRRTSESLKEAGTVSFEAIYNSILRAAESLSETLLSTGIIDPSHFQQLSANIAEQSLIGDSFIGLADPLAVKTSFRLNQADAEAGQIAEAYKALQSKRGIIICIPGIYQDESLWQSGSPKPIAELLTGQGYFPVYLRIHQGDRISVISQTINDMIESLLSLLPNVPVHFLSFSQGGLILRSVLHLNQKQQGSIRARTQKVIIVSSPDGGFFIEKTGLLFGLGLGEASSRAVKLMSFIGNIHSPAFRDMSLGIIRQEDEKKTGAILSTVTDHYFGELDNLDAYQIYSLISDSNHIWSHWLGDGLVEESSLAALSDQYRKSGDDRSHCLFGLSHFQILQSDEFQKILQQITEKP